MKAFPRQAAAVFSAVDDRDLGRARQADLHGNRPGRATGAQNHHVLAGRIGHFAERLHEALAVRVLAQEPPIGLPNDRVNRSDLPGGGGDLVQVRQHGDLVREGAVCPGKPHRPHPSHGVRQIVRRHLQRQVAPVEAKRLKGALLHVLGRVLRHRLPEQGDDLREKGSGYGHCVAPK